MSLSRRAALAGVLSLAAAPVAGQRLPRATLRPPPPGPSVADLTIDGVSIRLWQPGALSETGRAILFSHGAFSSGRNYDSLAGGWASEGHLVAAVTHSEPPQDGGAMDYAAAQAGWRARLADMRVAARELSRRAPGRPLIAAGHSYGALVAQALGGARVEWDGDGGPLPLPGVTRILAFSPPGPLAGFITA
ncbi:MAG: hypothetical protein ACK4MX_11880, partial [Thermaurantiacus sp.]